MSPFEKYVKDMRGYFWKRIFTGHWDVEMNHIESFESAAKAIVKAHKG